MLDYRCYFLNAQRKFKDVREPKSTDDTAAVLSAMRLLSAQAEFDNFELWEGARLVISSSRQTARATAATIFCAHDA